MKNKMLSVLCASLMITIIFSNVSADYNTGDDIDIFIDSFGNKNMVWREQVDGVYQVFYGYEIVDTIYNQNNITYYNEIIHGNIDFDSGYLTIQNCEINGDIIATQAQVYIEDCEINGIVKHTLGSLIIKSSNINGNVDVKNANLELRTSYVNGNVKTQTNTEDSYSVIITGNDINGNVDLKSGICYVVGNTINGNLKIKDPAIIQEVSDNEVNCNMQLTDNTGGFDGIQITNSTFDVMYPQVAIDNSSGMGYVLWVIDTNGMLEFWYTISPDMILWLEPKYGGILTYSTGNPELDMEAINGTLYITWKEGGELTVVPDYNDQPVLQVVGVSADRPLVHLNEPATITMKMSNTGLGSALYTAVNVTDIVGDNETLIDTSEIGIFQLGTEITYEFNWTPTITGIHYLKVEMQGKYITHHSPAELVEGPPTIMSVGLPVSLAAEEYIEWPGGKIINSYTQFPGINPSWGGRYNSTEIVIPYLDPGNLVIQSGRTLIFNDNVTFVIENPITDPHGFGITIQSGASFLISSPSRSTTIQSPSSTPTHTYPFLNSGTVDFMGANVLYTYGPSDLALAGGIQNMANSVCNLTDCWLTDADTHTVIATDSTLRIDGAETLVGKGDKDTLTNKGTGITISGNSNVVIDGVTVDYNEEYGIKCVDNGKQTRIENNTTIKNGKSDGIHLQNSDAIIENAEISNNDGNGILVEDGSAPQVERCMIEWNLECGIRVDNSASASICNSTINSNSGGIFLDTSYGMNILNNNISNNLGNGFYISNSPNTISPYQSLSDSQALLTGECNANRILIKLKNFEHIESRTKTLTKIETLIGCKATEFPNCGIVTLELNEGTTVARAIDSLSNDPEVLYAEPDLLVHLTNNTPNDPYWDDLWGMAKIDAPKAWDIATGNSGVVVAIIDTGVDYTHEDLSDNMWTNAGETGLDANGTDKATNHLDDDHNGYVDDVHGINAITGSGDPMDDYGHGTHCAGTVGAMGNNLKGVVGVNWNVNIMALKFINAAGTGYISDAIKCLEYAILMKENDPRIKVASNSWHVDFSQALYDAIAACRQPNNILFVAAAGNDGVDNDYRPLYPASYNLTNIISVAATDINDELAMFASSRTSNYGASSVDVAAPGKNIYSTGPYNDSYSYLSGTSMATPHVAGLAALIASTASSYDYINIKNLIMTTTDHVQNLSNKTVTEGRINAYNALSYIPTQMHLLVHSPGNNNNVLMGLPVDIIVSVSDGVQPIKNASVKVKFSNGESMISLYDNGIGGDQITGDGYYYGSWIPLHTGIVVLNVSASASGYNNMSKELTVLVMSINNIKNNTVNSNNCGLSLSSSNYNIIENNLISNNAHYGLYLDFSDRNTIVNNSVCSNNYDGIYLYSSNSNTIVSNNASSNFNSGMCLSFSSRNIIANNNASSNINYYGFYLVHSNNNIAANNKASFNGYDGFFLEQSSDNIVANNTVLNNDCGIYLYSSSSNTIVNNTASNNDYGINLNGDLYEPSNSNIINNNTASENEFGVYLELSNNNSITNNRILNNTYGVYITSSSGITMYHNNFINNTDQAYDDGTNQWDNGYPSGGNYWSDFDESVEGAWDNSSGSGQNLTGSDGIVDDPYMSILGGSGALDRYPLISPPSFGQFSIPIILGWNLISTPFIPCNTSIPHILSSIDGQWDVVKYYDTLDVADPWKTYRVNGTANDLFYLDHTMGFWLYITDVGNGFFTLKDRVPTITSIVLYEGWNLVGYPTLCENMTVANAFWGTGADHVDVFDPDDPTLLREAEPTYLMRPGEGYWVRVPEDCVWTVDW